MEIKRYERDGRRFDVILEEARGGGYRVEVVDVDAGGAPGWCDDSHIYPTQSAAIYAGCVMAREVIEAEV